MHNLKFDFISSDVFYDVGNCMSMDFINLVSLNEVDYFQHY